MRAEQDLVLEFEIERPTLLANNNDPQRMQELLQEEVDELKVEIDAGNTDKVAQELPDVIFFLFSIANYYGIDVENTFYAKYIRNCQKYPAHLFNNGIPYSEARKLCRDNWDRDNDCNFTPENI